MPLPKILLEPLVNELNSTRCPFCGQFHKVRISSNPVAYLEFVEDEGCAEWNADLNRRAKAILTDFFNPNSER